MLQFCRSSRIKCSLVTCRFWGCEAISLTLIIDSLLIASLEDDVTTAAGILNITPMTAYSLHVADIAACCSLVNIARLLDIIHVFIITMIVPTGILK